MTTYLYRNEDYRDEDAGRAGMGQQRTMAELNRIAEQNENITSRPDWWRQRSEILDAAAAEEVPDWDTIEVRKALARLGELEATANRGIRNGQLTIEVGKAYRRLASIAARRPDLAEGQDIERWERLWLEI